MTDDGEPDASTLPEGVLAVRLGPGANCSSAGSAIDVLFYASVAVGAVAVALAAVLAETKKEERQAPPRSDEDAQR